ncbi:refilin B [Boleophthalmus pectinirostris]|uniref:refilin B n=1 Tax=Boleophthalmus pectinirostris TaxID=150288 RepID=UPI000A1C56FB|nr:refilin B [Boleophthalmus pectinirostris]
MVGRLNLPNVSGGDPLDMSCCRADRGLDSPDSGLPPSPSPSAWLPGPADKEEGKSSLAPSLPTRPLPQLQPLSYGEGVSLSPLPAKEMRYTSCMSYDSDRHFIQNVTLRPWGQELEHCRQTIVAMPHSTWRHYKTQLEFEPRHRPHQFSSTAIIYPKKTSVMYTTELSYDCHRLVRHFISSVELEASGHRQEAHTVKR